MPVINALWDLYIATIWQPIGVHIREKGHTLVINARWHLQPAAISKNIDRESTMQRNEKGIKFYINLQILIDFQNLFISKIQSLI